jgi:hypothetical protein
MEGKTYIRSIIPDRQIIHILPTVSHLQILVVDYETKEEFQEGGTLEAGDVVDVGDMVAKGEDRFPLRMFVS